MWQLCFIQLLAIVINLSETHKTGNHQRPPPHQQCPPPQRCERQPCKCDSHETTAPQQETCQLNVVDRTLAADSIEEAILNFPNVFEREKTRKTEQRGYLGAMNTPQRDPNVFQFGVRPQGQSTQNTNPILYSDGKKCGSSECRSCSLQLLPWLERSGVLRGTNVTDLRNKLQLGSSKTEPCTTLQQFQSNAMHPLARTTTCQSNATTLESIVNILFGDKRASSHTKDPGDQQCLNRLVQTHCPLQSDSNMQNINRRRKEQNSSQSMVERLLANSRHHRTRRDEFNITSLINQQHTVQNSDVAITNDDFNIPVATFGTRYKIQCLQRGESSTSADTHVRLCDICWVWRQLPDGYFPQYLNEITCVVDGQCLGGYGDCMTESRSVDVLPDKSNPQQVETIEVATSCGCQVKKGSTLSNFARA